MRPLPATIGILHPGEMGAALGGLLRAQGHRVLFAPAGRSALTRERAAAAGLEPAGSLAALAASAECVLSLVPPDAAEATAQAFAAALANDRAPLFADLNSIGPDTAKRIASALRERRVRCVDGALHGQAGRLRDRALLFLSGPDAPGVARLFGGSLETRLLGDELGAASRMKMLLSCMSKALVALCLEVGAAAHEAGTWDAFWEAAGCFYPELVAAAERMAPTYPRHAARRVAELFEAEATLAALGCDAGLVRESRRVIRALAAASLPADAPPGGGASRLPEILGALRAARAQRACAPHTPTTDAKE